MYFVKNRHPLSDNIILEMKNMIRYISLLNIKNKRARGTCASCLTFIFCD